ncbi:MAG: phosphate/phosphite/phosphonate ABC transporter substrate-binding protein [Sphingomonadales bacterium]|nr:phosphate/phosphite/phosphonate ABC transporter substrate-binding protein [Sphingomonadales bacterium]
MMRLSALLLVLFSMVAVPAQAADGAISQKTLSFGVVPQQASSKLVRLWVPIFQHIKNETGLTLVFKTAPDIPTFEDRVNAGVYDLAYMNPYHYVVFAQQPGYRAFAKQKDKKIIGLVVVHKNSGITDISQLHDKSVAFPSSAAFAASILTRAFLAKEGISITAEYVNSHDSVYRNVAAMRFAAGGGIGRTLNSVAPDVRAELSVLWRSKGYTPHAFAAHPRVAAENVALVRQAFVDMAKTEEGQKLLAALKFTGIEPAVSSDWDDVRGLEIQKSGIKTGLRE